MKKLFPVLFILLIANTVFAQSSQLPLTGLLAWYPFCGNSSDQSGNGYDLSNTDPLNIVPVPDRFGNANTAYTFNGGTGDLDFGAPFLPGAAASDFTYSCWIYPTTAQSSVVWYNGNPAVNGYGLYMNDGTLGTPGTNVDIVFGGAVGLFAPVSVTLLAWHHVVFSRNGGAYRLIVDGAVNTFVPAPFATPTGQFTIGQDFANPGASGFSGLIDDIAIYNRYIAPAPNADMVALNNLNPDVTAFNLGILNPDTAVCVNSLTLTPSPAFDTSYDYLWSTGSTGVSITATVDPAPGNTYYLTITKPYGCSLTESASMHQIKVKVDLGASSQIFCVEPGSVQAELYANTDPVETFIWSTGETTDSITVTADGTYWVSVDSLGCSGSDTANVTLRLAPLVNIGPDTLSCDGTPINLRSSYSYPAGTTFAWGGIPTLTGVTTAISYTFTVPGTYWLTVSQGPCSASDTANVGIYFDSLVLETPNTKICKGGNVQIVAHGNPSATNSWTPTAGIASAFSVNPLIIPDTSAWYTVDAAIGGCHVKDSLFIEVQPVPSVYMGGNRSVCRGDTIHITASVQPTWYTHYVYYWTPGTNLDHSSTTVTDSALGTVVFTAGDSTSLILSVYSQDTSLGCFGIDSAQILVHTPHDTLLEDASMCPGDSVILNPHPTVNSHYMWHPGTYLDDSTATQPVARPINTMEYWVQSTDRYGCHDTLFQNVRVLPNAVIYLGDSVTLYPGERFQISPQTNCVNFSWSPWLGLNDTSIANPIASPSVSTKYIVHATTEWGCLVIDSLSFHVDPASLLAIPNAFTPGNGVNNTLKVITKGAVQLHYFRIFNRWGNKVFETNNLSEGWDGTFNGALQPFGVYVYDVEAVTSEATIFHNTGNVTLIR